MCPCNDARNEQETPGDQDRAMAEAARDQFDLIAVHAAILREARLEFRLTRWPDASSPIRPAGRIRSAEYPALT